MTSKIYFGCIEALLIKQLSATVRLHDGVSGFCLLPALLPFGCLDSSKGPRILTGIL